MRLQDHLHAPHTVALRPWPISTKNTSRAACASPPLRRLLWAIPLFLLPFAGRPLFAQAPPEPDANMDQPYDPNTQYDPGAQPYSSQPQPYSQQPYSASPAYPQQPAYDPAQPQPLSADQLQQLVAPIALYPDQLIALILAASTYPGQVADADSWRQAQGYVSPDQIAAGVNLQNWDSSVKALTVFPQVLSEMDANLAWTSALGNAYYNQPQDVLQAVQMMRQRAQSAGSLQSTPQQSVSYDQGYIQVVPANPQVVYVPAYNPWTVYGQPVSPYPGFALFGALNSFLNPSTLTFGLGVAMSAFSHASWGWLGWGVDWLAHSVLFHESNYASNSTSVADWGLRRGGPRAFGSGYGQPGRRYGPAPTHGFSRSQGTYASNSPRSNYSHGYQTPEFGNNRPQLQAWNRNPAPLARTQTYPQTYNHAGYGYGPSNGFGARFQARPGQTYAAPLLAYGHNAYAQNYSRPGYGSNSPGIAYPGTTYPGRNYSSAAYANRSAQPAGKSYQAYRAPSANLRYGNYGQRPSPPFTGNGFMSASGKQSSGGFHVFGGGHASNNFNGGHAPKSFGSEKDFGGGHSGGFHSFGGGHPSFSGHSGGHSGGHRRL